MIFRRAFCTQGENTHGCVQTVIRNVLDNGKPRTAVGAVNKGISVPGIIGIKQLGKTITAGCNLRRYRDELFFMVFTFSDNKIIIADRLDVMTL